MSDDVRQCDECGRPRLDGGSATECPWCFVPENLMPQPNKPHSGWVTNERVVGGMIDHAKLRRLAHEAHEGPWRMVERDNLTDPHQIHAPFGNWQLTIVETDHAADAAYVAAASPDVVLGLLNDIARLRHHILFATPAPESGEAP